MPVNQVTYHSIIKELPASVTLVAVSKTKPKEDIQELYDLGQRHFGENYVQELIDKQAQLSTDIHWHFIGHLQSNKVKYIAPFVYLIHGVDSFSLLKEINKQAGKNNRIIDCLLQVHIAQEDTKFGFSLEEILELPSPGELPNVNIVGLMGMASFTSDLEQVKKEFATLKQTFNELNNKVFSNSLTTLSMGMSGDYALAIEEGSTMVRIGSLLFGERQYS